MKLAFNIINNFPTLRNFIFKNTDLNAIRNWLGIDFLSPLQKYIMDGYDDFLYSNLNLNEDSIVVILGGYRGVSSKSIIDRYNPYMHIIEPIPTYFNYLQGIFNGEKAVVYQFAAHSANELITMGLAGEETGIRATTQISIQVEAKDIGEFIRSLNEKVDLIEINIEGGEYAVIDHLIATENIKLIRTLLIQFHQYDFNDEYKRAKLRKFLNKTHENIFTYPWVWERWDIRN